MIRAMPVLIDAIDRSPKSACCIVRDGRLSQAFTVPSQWMERKDTATNEAQLAQGLIPSMNSFHGLMCRPCQACVWVRINMADFHLSQSNRRVFAENADLHMEAHDTAKRMTSGDVHLNEYMVFITPIYNPAHMLA